MPSNPNQSPEGFEIYRCEFVAGQGCPCVIIAWSQHSGYGDAIALAEYFIVREAVPVHHRRVQLEMRYVHPESAKAEALPTLAALAREHAVEDLEKLIGQMVKLERITADVFRIFSQRNAFAESWKPVIEETYCGSLRQLFREIDQSAFHGMKFVEPKSRRG